MLNQMHQESQANSPVLLIGIGNEYRSDDGLGPMVAREMRRRMPEGLRIREESGEGASLIESWKEADAVFLVDAISSGEPPGTLHRFDARSTRIPAHFFSYSSHRFGLAEAVEMARELQQLPGTLFVYGLEGQCFEAGIGLSEDVLKRVPELIHMIDCDMRIWMSDHSERS